MFYSVLPVAFRFPLETKLDLTCWSHGLQPRIQGLNKGRGDALVDLPTPFWRTSQGVMGPGPPPLLDPPPPPVRERAPSGT